VSLLARLFLERGRQVIIEETTYPGLPIIVRPYQPEFLTVPSDSETGMDVDTLAALLESGVNPAFIYTMSDGHNPLGTSMNLAKRERLVNLARRHRVPIIEDDVYGFLFYGDKPEPALRALDADWVFYLGSFSKMLGPSLRTGWMIVPEALMSRLSVIKDMSDIDTCTISQRAITVYLESGRFGEQLASVRCEYRERRDIMLRALETHFPPGTKWSVPGSGVFIWVELPGEVDTTELFRAAVEREQVAFFPGAGFCIEENRRASRCMRMNFTNCAREQIEDGIMRLGRVINQQAT
jgi:2-aminoadipate transaminase